MNAQSRGLSSRRHELLDNLLQLTAPTTARAEQEQIVSQLYETPLHTLEECLLQVSHVCITHTQEEVQGLLRGFMLWLAGCSLLAALRLSWTVDAVSDFYRSTGLGDRVKEIQDCVESYAINQVSQLSRSSSATTMTGGAARGAIATTSSMASGEDGESATDMSQVLRKELRLRVYNDERNFVKVLTDISDALRMFPDRPKRKSELHRYLHALNERLSPPPPQCCSSSSSPSTLMVMHPLGASSDPVRWVVNIIVEECTVFSSRERAPYLIRYEVIVDDTATMADPSASRLRMADGRFRVRADSDETFVPSLSSSSSAAAFDSMSEGEGASASEFPVSAEAAQIQKLAFGESLSSRTTRVRQHSRWGQHPKWGMSAMIVKAGDDLRQEELALQVIHTIHSMWKEAGITCRVHPYIALPTHADCGLLEVVDDSNSIDGIKKACGTSSIYQFFKKAFDGESSAAYRLAQRNFVETMAGYSVLTYLLQIKDRHNGNLMVARTGEIVHIDFGFLLGTSPGSINFESAPFKLSQELLDLLGGQGSDTFSYYKILVYQALDAARERAEDIIALVGIMTPYTTMPCFGSDPAAAVAQVRNRFRYDLASEADYAIYTRELVTTSTDNWRTRRYDQFQTLQNGIL